MTQTLPPSLSIALWCNGSADEAAQFYTRVFRDASIVEQVPGLTTTLSIHGFQLSLINGDDRYVPNQSISCILNFDPLLFGGEAQARAYLDELYEELSTGGVLMELGEYPFSPRYAWVRDRFLAADAHQPRGRPAPLRHPLIHVWRQESRQCRRSHQQLAFYL